MTFIEWVAEQREQRGWTQNELARRMGTSSGRLSMILNEQRGFKADFCRELARALDLPEIVVFVQAGLMSQTTNPDELTLRELYGLLSALPPDDQRAILAEARARYQAAPSVRTAPDCASS